MTHHPSFDPADLAAAIHRAEKDKAAAAAPAADATSGTVAPTTRPLSNPPVGPTPGRWIGVALVAALIMAVSVAISLAVQLGPESATPEPTPLCGGLYDDCCDTFDQDGLFCERPCNDPNLVDLDEEPGLFDVEAEFADRIDRPGC